jgi:hypothetical protein
VWWSELATKVSRVVKHELIKLWELQKMLLLFLHCLHVLLLGLRHFPGFWFLVKS